MVTQRTSPHGTTLRVATRQHTELVNLTARAAACVPAGFNGLCYLFCPHTTAGLTLNENADPDVVHDLLLELDRLVPWRNPAFRHGEGNSAAHVKASLMGASLALPVAAGHLQLGPWQGAFLCEFDGPRQRLVHLHLIPTLPPLPAGEPL